MSQSPNVHKSSRIGLFLGPVLFSIISLIEIDGLSSSAQMVLAAVVWIATWWITECIPIAVTSLLPIILFPLTGAMSVGDTAAAYGHKYIFLYIGGFMLAIAIEQCGLHRRIALNIIKVIGTKMSNIVLGFMTATAFLSMWISNTATSVMMLPIGLAIIKQVQDNPLTVKDEHAQFGKALMLAIAYSASIGGIATIIGTPPNLILASTIEELYQIEISFAQWFIFGLPLSLILLSIAWWYLTRKAFDLGNQSFPGGKQEIDRLLTEQGRMSVTEKRVLAVFVLTAVAWISRKYLLQQWLPGIEDTIIALIAGMALFIIPSGNSEKKNIITWEEAVKLPWGILLLFGGGLAIAQGFKTTGLADWFGSLLNPLDALPFIALLFIIVMGINFLTEITSNLATTAMILPVLAALAVAINVSPILIMAAAAVSASCAFMLPVATPPNAVVFGSGYLRIKDMLRVGSWLNLISIVIVVIAAYYYLPLIWEL